ncbi:type II toxin-antitoxin system RelE/ParE family toxin [Pseudomonas savastanoi]|uniref:type II toxin-antitoxin system RelE/ParE family toxin n=1 Tax=Pseudomonas savastanoi TaxID=29438 RepID=UPI000E32C18B|nr:type II toxin-antitoxin system RelE/ParE family toxin [Pseudomonas savastanoi]
MSDIYIRYTDLAQSSLEDQVEHLSLYQDFTQAMLRVSNLIDTIQDKLLSAPLGYPISPQLSDLGVLHYRELNTGGYRVFYEIVEADNAIVVKLVLGSKQSVESALIRYCLMQPI